MKKTLSNLKQSNHFIQETEEAIKTVKSNKSLSAKEKTEKVKEYNTHLNRLLEAKRRVLEQLKCEVEKEIQDISDYLMD